MIAIGIVALIHVLLGYAFITGLALKAVKAVVNKVEAVNIKDKAPPPDEPPPPPPKDIEIPPYVPPPEVSIAQDAQPVITTQTTISQPEPPRYIAPPAPPAPPAPKAESPPTAATPKGRGTQSSGFPRLDEQACKVIIRRFRFNPATREGQPVPETKTQPVRWQLKDAR